MDFNTKNDERRLPVRRHLSPGRHAGPAPAFGRRLCRAWAPRPSISSSSPATAVQRRPLGAFEVESYGVGPTVSYARKFGNTQAVLDVQWLPQLHVENTTKGNFIWVKLGLVF